MVRAIHDYEIAGVSTTLPFCVYALKHEAFVSGKFDTNFVKHHFSPEVLKRTDDQAEELASILGLYFLQQDQPQSIGSEGLESASKTSMWKKNRGF